MPRALILCVMATFASGCGGSSSGNDQPTPAAPSPTAAAEGAGETSTGAGSSLPSADTGSPAAASRVSGPPRANRYLQLAVTGAGFDPASPAAPPGQRYYTVGLRGIGRSRSNDVLLEFQPFVFAQNDRGCISRPEPNAPWLKQPFGATALFTAANPTEGQLAFTVPEETQRVRVLIAPATGDGLIVPAGEDFTPSWPAPIQTIEDGSTLRVLVLPSAAPPASLPPPAAGREYLVLDFVIENRKSTQGIEFTTSQQLRLVDPAGTFVQPVAVTKQLGCRLDDGDVIPPGHARRFMVAYDITRGAPRRLQYRGFEVDEVSVDLQ